jgi:hypothetical protein
MDSGRRALHLLEKERGLNYAFSEVEINLLSEGIMYGLFVTKISLLVIL